MEGFKFIPYIALMIVISGVMLGAGAIVLDQFGDTTTDATATAAIDNASAAVGDVSEQLGTVAIIGIMVIIISIIGGVFVYLKFFS